MTDSEEFSVPGAERSTGPDSGDGPEPDVLLDVPKVSVNSIQLSVDRLDADLSCVLGLPVCSSSTPVFAYTSRASNSTSTAWRRRPC